MVEYRDIPGTDGLYQATNDCRIWSVKRKMFLKQQTDSYGYKHVDLRKDGVRMPYRVNRLVFEAFYRRLQTNEQAHHINQIRDDNRPTNLVGWDKSYHVTMHDTGVKQSEETKAKRSKALTGRKLSEEHVAKLKGRVISQQTRQKMRLAKLGTKHTEQWKKQQSQRMKGNTWGFEKGRTPWNKGQKKGDVA